MVLGQRYNAVVENFNKIGRAFTGSNGNKYTTYQVMLKNSPMLYLMTLPSNCALDTGDEIEFTFSLDKNKKFRLRNVTFNKNLHQTYFPSISEDFDKMVMGL